MRRLIPVAVALLLPGCGTITINMKDGTARINACPGVEFAIQVRQGPFMPTARATASGGVVRFSSSAFSDIDFSRRVTVDVFASTVPPDSACPFRAGDRYRLADVVLPAVPGQSDTYEVDLANAERVP